LSGKDEATAGTKLSSQQPHRPSRRDRAAKKHYKAIEAIADHVARGFAVGDAKNDGSEQREHRRRTEVIENDGHAESLHKEIVTDRVLRTRYWLIVFSQSQCDMHPLPK
jgi:hypothetical protein